MGINDLLLNELCIFIEVTLGGYNSCYHCFKLLEETVNESFSFFFLVCSKNGLPQICKCVQVCEWEGRMFWFILSRHILW